VLLSLLGRGGFSEVWKAYDLAELREVAVKIHQLDPRWSDAKKESFTKHVSREYEIHRGVRHPRIVSLFDVFEIDMNSFATVLECCQGSDLDALLKERGTLPEAEARAVLLQILVGMRYLSQPSQDGTRQGIIHYDLKPGTIHTRKRNCFAAVRVSFCRVPPPTQSPSSLSLLLLSLAVAPSFNPPGNILFDENGDAKITDFGLSKILESSPSGLDAAEAVTSLELTSQGAGTYWYLPPECFVLDRSVRISNKVDVWAIGVIYYQMLYGRRPFGDGMTQDRILSDRTMLGARTVPFPDDGDNNSAAGRSRSVTTTAFRMASDLASASGSAMVVVSPEAKDFIRACLRYDQADRPTIAQLCEHPYVLSLSPMPDTRAVAGTTPTR
jgi:tousled-like kinase